MAFLQSQGLDDTVSRCVPTSTVRRVAVKPPKPFKIRSRPYCMSGCTVQFKFWSGRKDVNSRPSQFASGCVLIQLTYERLGQSKRRLTLMKGPDQNASIGLPCGYAEFLSNPVFLVEEEIDRPPDLVAVQHKEFSGPLQDFMVLICGLPGREHLLSRGWLC